MTLDPRLRPLLALHRRMGDDDATFPTKRLEGTIQARQFGWLLMRRGPDVPTREVMVPVDGGAIRVRLYEPEAAGPRPLHLHIHGGGWCVGDLDQSDPRCRAIAVETGATVASVDYRLAPENAFPVPVEDCYSALEWLVGSAGELGVDPERVSVGGSSAGGNLATVVAILARDRGGPPLVFQWLDVPAVDLTMSHPSVSRLGTGHGLTEPDMKRYLSAYLADADPTNPMVSPLFADLSGLPPALVSTCGYDPLTDEGHAYVDRLRAAGVPVVHEHGAGLIHASFSFTRLLPAARRNEATASAMLRAAYGHSDAPA